MPDQVVLALTFTAIMIIVGSGMYVLSRLCGQLSLVAAAYMAIGACVSSYLARSEETSVGGLSGRGLSFAIALAIAIIVTATFAMFFGFVTYKFRGPLNMISGVAISAIVVYLLDRANFLSGTESATAAKTIEIGGKSLSSNSGLLALSLIVALAAIIYVRNITRSPFSRSMRAINELTGQSGNERAAATNAISPMNTIIGAHFICGLTAGAAGALYSQFLGSFSISALDPWAGLLGIIVSVQILVLIVAGGLKNFWVTITLVGLLGFVAALLAEYSDSIDFIDFSETGNVSPAHVVGILAALMAILVIQTAGRTAKNKL